MAPVTERPHESETPQADPSDDDVDEVELDLGSGPETGAVELELELEVVSDPDGDELAAAAPGGHDAGDEDDEDELIEDELLDLELDDEEDDELDDDVGEIDETVGDGRVAYDCTSWAGESRGLLAGLLDTSGIRHAWQGTTVTVFEEDEERVDALIDDVLASARPALDPTAEKVVYEVGSWPAALQTSLADALTVADLPYEWDERGDLVVYAEHEEEVEAILDELPDPDDPELVEGELWADDGIVVHELLDGLFLAGGRLAKRVDDAASILKVDEVAGDLERMPPPFGFEPGQWRTLVGRAVRLRDALAAAPGSDDALDDHELSTLAGEVRGHGRPDA